MPYTDQNTDSTRAHLFLGYPLIYVPRYQSVPVIRVDLETLFRERNKSRERERERQNYIYIYIYI